MEGKPLKDIYIPQPCHQDWDKMTPTEKGRFCKTCSQQVHDFTNSTYSEIEIILKNSKGKTCGTFYEDQLNQDLRYVQKENSGIFKRFKLSAFTFFAFLWLKIGTSSSAYTQDVSDLKDTVSVVNEQKEKESEKKIRIIGVFQNKNTGQSLAFIKFKIYDNNGKLVAASESDGKNEFDMGIDEKYEGKELRLTTKNTKRVGPRSVFKHKSTSIIFTADSSKKVVVEIEVTKKKKLFAKKRIVVTGKFRM